MFSLPLLYLSLSLPLFFPSSLYLSLSVISLFIIRIIGSGAAIAPVISGLSRVTQLSAGTMPRLNASLSAGTDAHSKLPLAPTAPPVIFRNQTIAPPLLVGHKSATDITERT